MGKGLTPGDPCGAHTTYSRAEGWTRATRWCGGSTAPLLLSFGLRLRDSNIWTGVFVPCNSENIYRATFLKRKIEENWKLALDILLIG